jgi:hypothetical protein
MDCKNVVQRIFCDHFNTHIAFIWQFLQAYTYHNMSYTGSFSTNGLPKPWDPLQDRKVDARPPASLRWPAILPLQATARWKRRWWSSALVSISYWSMLGDRFPFSVGHFTRRNRSLRNGMAVQYPYAITINCLKHRPQMTWGPSCRLLKPREIMRPRRAANVVQL